MSSQRCDADHWIFASRGQRVAQGPGEEGGLDLEAVAGLGLDAVGAAQDGGS